MTLAPGQILNQRYRIVTLLGQGGFGAVYRAWDLSLNGPCAVKENNETSPEARRQFAHEASLLFNLRHPNLPKVFDSFSLPGQGQYLVMEYIDGEDLQCKLERSSGALPEAQVLTWAAQICNALQYLHTRTPAIIHRDIKPGNIRITPQGEAVLVDFGIAKVYNPELRTTVGARAVTPGYSPPEQYGQGATDARSDIYALGATLYVLLTGQAIPDSVDVMTGARPAARAAHLLNPAVSPPVSAALQRATRMSREKRFEDMAQFKAALLRPGETEPAHFAPPARANAPAPYQPTLVIKQSQSAPLSKVQWGWIGALALAFVIAAGVLLSLMLRDARFAAAFSGTATAQAQLAAMPTASATATAIPPSPSPTTTPTFTPLPASPTPAPTDTPTPAPSLTPVDPPTPAATALPAGQVIDAFGVRMVIIPEGRFWMGSQDGAIDERPLHEVQLPAYLIDVFEVTNGNYAQCVQAGACTLPWRMKSLRREKYYGEAQFDNFPVVYVSWEMASAYCQWRGGRLPTEAEWERAARGEDGRAYPWGDGINCERANSGTCTMGDTSAVDSHPAGVSPYGLYHAAGNVWEWVADWYLWNVYTISHTFDPRGPEWGEKRVVRGGSWEDISNTLRAANREALEQGYYYDVGFRCARTP